MNKVFIRMGSQQIKGPQVLSSTPAEAEYPIAFFKTTESKYGEQRSLTWDGVCNLIRHSPRDAKEDVGLFAAALLGEEVDRHGELKARRTKQYIERQTMVVLDVDCKLEHAIKAPQPLQMIETLKKQWGGQLFFYTSHSHTPEAPRYRIGFPIDPDLTLPAGFQPAKHIAQRLGLTMWLDNTKLTANCLFYLPSCPPQNLEHAAAYASRTGGTLGADFFAEYLEVYNTEEAKREEERQAAASRATERRAEKIRTGGDSGSLIEKARPLVPSVPELLSKHGYTRVSDKWLHPNSKSGIPGVSILMGDDEIERAYSHNYGDPIYLYDGGGKACDNIDLLCIFEFGGEWKATVQYLSKLAPHSEEFKQRQGNPFEGFEGFDRHKDGEDASTAPKGKIPWLTSDSNNGPVLNGNWLVKKWIPAEGIGVMFGRPGCGKSFLSTDLGLHVAAGMSWRGLKTKQAGVSYVSAEAGRMGENRIHAWMKHHGLPWPDGFRMSPVAMDLRSTRQNADLLIADIKANQPDCGLVIIDTLARSMGGGDENSGQDMGAFVDNCGRVANDLGCFLVIIHHSGKDVSRGSRGHSSLLGAIWTELEVDRERGEPGLFTLSKQRDGEDGLQLGFDLHSVELGVDEDSEAVSSAVIVSLEADYVKQQGKTVTLGKNQKVVVDAFNQWICDNGQLLPFGTGFPDNPTIKGAVLDAFVNFAAGKISSREKPTEQRKAVRDAVEGLKEKRLLAQNGGFIWWIGKE